MIKKISEYLTMIIDKLYSTNSIEKQNKKVIHVILKNDLLANLKDNEEEILFGCGCFWGAAWFSFGGSSRSWNTNI